MGKRYAKGKEGRKRGGRGSEGALTRRSECVIEENKEDAELG